jgi:hypothetical protein
MTYLANRHEDAFPRKRARSRWPHVPAIHDACATGKGGKRIQDFGRTLKCDAEIPVSLIARDLRFAHTQTSRELALGDALRNARGNE